MAEPTVEPSSAKESKFKLHCAIDFGTDGIGMAYACNGEVYVHNRWCSKKYAAKIKRKTSILMDDKGVTQAFGKDARASYIGLPQQKNIWMLFERFKMMLYLNDQYDEKQQDKIPIKMKLKATNGKELPSGTVFVAAFEHLKTESERFLKKNNATKQLFKELKSSEIQWIITVPAIWNDAAKHKMREWAIAAKLVDPTIHNQCKIVYEPDCASLSIQYLIRDSKGGQVFNLNDEKDKNDESLWFSQGDKYVLVDAGGGTVDIACHEIVGAFGVKEIYSPSGGAWGGCYIDDKYIDLLKQIFSSKWMNELEEEAPDVYMDIIDDFQKAKETFFVPKNIQNIQNIQKAHNVHIALNFREFMENKLEQLQTDDQDYNQDIEHFVSNCKVYKKENLVQLNDEYLEIDVSIWRKMFDHVIDPIINHIINLLNAANVMKNCKYICLVGGMSCSQYFQFKMKQEFGAKSKYGFQVIIPKRPMLSVVEGAAYFGITNNYIKARRMQKSYGFIVNEALAFAIERDLPQYYIDGHKIWNEKEKQYYIRSCFLPIILKNQEIYINQVKTHTVSRASDSPITTVRIFCSDLENPQFENDGKYLAEVTIEWNDNDSDVAEVVTEWHFYGTVLKTIVYKKTNPQNRKEVELSYDFHQNEHNYESD